MQDFDSRIGTIIHDFTEHFIVDYVGIFYFLLKGCRKHKQEKMLIQICCKLAVSV